LDQLKNVRTHIWGEIVGFQVLEVESHIDYEWKVCWISKRGNPLT
jgi:metal-sulfur cluster biosynthetic enzyme